MGQFENMRTCNGSFTLLPKTLHLLDWQCVMLKFELLLSILVGELVLKFQQG